MEWLTDLIYFCDVHSGFFKVFFLALGGSASVIGTIYKWVIPQWKEHNSTEDLHPYLTKAEVKHAKKYFVRTKIQFHDPSDDNELSEKPSLKRLDAIDYLINECFENADIQDQYFLFLADSGMGKTTFSINLYLKYARKLFKKYRIKWLPLSRTDVIDTIKSIAKDEAKRTILILDAFDEDLNALQNHKQRLDEFINASNNFRFVIITCRTQFFESEEEEPDSTGIPSPGGEKGIKLFRKYYLCPFNDFDVQQYLTKKYSSFGRKREMAFQIVTMSPNLMIRPMLLNYIDDLLENTSGFTYTFEIYKELINKWIFRETAFFPPKLRFQSQTALLKLSHKIARVIYDNKSQTKKYIISKEVIGHIWSESGVENKEQPLFNLKNRSLLNRNIRGELKFSHKSILEYFLYEELLEENYDYNTFDFDGFDMTLFFYREMILKKMNISGDIHWLTQSKKVELILEPSPNMPNDPGAIIVTVKIHQTSSKLDMNLRSLPLNLFVLFNHAEELTINAIQLKFMVGIDSEILKPLNKLKKLTIWSIDFVKAFFSNLPVSLEQLTLHYPTYKISSEIGHLTNLKDLWIHCDDYKECMALANLPKLENLSLTANNLDIEGMIWVRNNLKNINITFAQDFFGYISGGIFLDDFLPQIKKRKQINFQIPNSPYASFDNGYIDNIRKKDLTTDLSTWTGDIHLTRNSSTAATTAALITELTMVLYAIYGNQIALSKNFDNHLCIWSYKNQDFIALKVTPNVTRISILNYFLSTN